MTTTLTMRFFRSGMGDQQAAEQFSTAFAAFVQKRDPAWGHVVIAAGIHGEVLNPPKGDINLHWWWSGSDREDWLKQYVETVPVKPQAILCTSRKMFDHARKLNLKALYLPVATGREFYPMDLPRAGVGYCGTAGHKDAAQERCMIAPAREYGGFEWLTNVPGGRPALNEWYNRKAVCLGMTATVTQSWGIVPTRTYEVLAGANPYVTYRHPTMSETLGFEYPYQSATPEETTAWIKELTDHYEAHKRRFARYSRIVQQYHTWDHRMRTLAYFLDKEL